jgi:hypothetical protein
MKRNGWLLLIRWWDLRFNKTAGNFLTPSEILPWWFHKFFQCAALNRGSKKNYLPQWDRLKDSPVTKHEFDNCHVTQNTLLFKLMFISEH